MSTVVPEPTVPYRGGIRAEPLPPPAGLVELVTTQNTPPRTLRELNEKRRLWKMRVGTLTAATLLRDTPPRPGFRPDRWAMVTPTYRPDVAWSPRHLTTLTDHIRKWCDRKGIPCRYVWVAETQKNGRVHWHILVALPRGMTLPKPDKQGWWPHGMTRIEWARNAVGYLVKYASKGGQNPLPKGCRMHGCGGLTPDQRLQRSFALTPRYVRDHFGSYTARVRRGPPGVGGWFSMETGEWIPAPPLILDFRGTPATNNATSTTWLRFFPT